ncbi:MAG: hypothetical protein H0U58_02265 [Chloroflexi bacterium]|nr:hypothetical protein [Chloroflexota bacterium]
MDVRTRARPRERVRMLALDLGAHSGRGILGAFDGDRLVVEEIHRFANEPFRPAT